MAEVLFHRGNGTQWLALDPIAVKPDGWVWGSREVGPGTSFFLVKLPGLSEQDLLTFCDAQYDMTDPANPVLVLNRQYTLDVTKLPRKFAYLVTVDGGGRYIVAADIIVLDKPQERSGLASAIKTK